MRWMSSDIFRSQPELEQDCQRREPQVPKIQSMMAPKARLLVLRTRLLGLERRMAPPEQGLPRRSRAQMQVQEMPPERPKLQERDFSKRSETQRGHLMQPDLRLQSVTDSHFHSEPGYQKRSGRDCRMKLVLDFHLTQVRDFRLKQAQDFQMTLVRGFHSTLVRGFHLTLVRGFQTI